MNRSSSSIAWPLRQPLFITESKNTTVKDAGKIAETLGVVGKNPNAIPSATPNQHSERRPVRVGSHPVGGWLLARIVDVIGTVAFGPTSESGSTFDTKGPPDPTYHWGVIVGEFYHELNTDKDFNNMYQNGRFNGKEWKVFHIGHTTFNDETIRLAGYIPYHHYPSDSVDPTTHERTSSVIWPSTIKSTTSSITTVN